MPPAGTRSWRWKYRVDGKEKKRTFGIYPEVSLAEARKLPFKARQNLVKGNDPMAERKEQKAAVEAETLNTFAAVAKRWYGRWKVGKDTDHAGQVLRRLKNDIFPMVGDHPIATLKAKDVVAVAKKIESRGAQHLGKRTLGTMSSVFRYGIAQDLCESNPAAMLKPSDVLKEITTTNFARIEARELPALLQRIDLYRGSQLTRLAMMPMSLTFLRTGELIEAEWKEFDFEGKKWTVPAARMKRTKVPTPHIVPLSRQTLTGLTALHELTCEGRRVDTKGA